MIFFTKYIRPKREVRGEVNNGKELVEKAGYVPPDKLIRKFIQAGIRLDAAKSSGLYEFQMEEDIPDDWNDPTRTPGFDIADGSILAESHARYIRSKIETAKRKKAAEAAKKGDQGSEGPDPKPQVGPVE